MPGVVARAKENLFSAPVILGLGVIFLFLTCIYPFLTLFGKVLFSGPEQSLDLSHLVYVLKSASTQKAIGNTLWVSFWTSLVSVLLALPLAWIFTQTDLPRAGFFRSLFCLPYAIPPYIGAIAWIYLANPTNGLLNLALGEGSLNVYTYPGLIWVMGSFFYTFVLLSVLSSLDRLDTSMIEAARLSGASSLRVFFQIIFPLILPSVLSGTLLVALASAASFGVPALIGNPARIFLMTTKIYTLQKMGSLNGIYQAGALSIVLLLLAVVVLSFNQYLSKRYSFQTVSGKASRASLIELGRWKWPVVVGLVGLIGILFLLPVLGIMITALSQIPGEWAMSNFGWANFSRVLFEMEETGRAFWNSFRLGVGAATAATLLGVLISFVRHKTRLPGRSVLELIASVPFSIPGTVVALALIMTFSGRLFGVFPSLYNTLTLLWLAYLTKYLSFAVRTSGDGFTQIDDCLAEAARVSGASWFKTLTTIWLPLLKPSLVAAWFLVFMPVFSELTMTIMLSGPGMETVGTLLFQLQEYADVSGGGAAVLAIVIIACVTTVNLLVKAISKGKYGL